MARMLSDARRKIVFVPTLADHHAPTIAELTDGAALQIQCLIATDGFALGSTGEDEVDDSAFCSDANDKSPGRKNYEAGMKFFRGTTPTDDIAWNTFITAGIEGYLVQRMGREHGEPFSVGEEVQVYQFITGNPMLQSPEPGKSEKFMQKFYIQGGGSDERAVVAA